MLLRISTFAFGWTLALALACAHAQTAGERIEKGVSAPSSRRELAFPYQGIIGKVEVKEGEPIKSGQVLLLQDERIEKKRLEGLRLEADRTLVIKAKEAAMENKKVELKRAKEMFDKQALSESEYLKAQLEVVLAQAEVEVSRHEQKTKVAEAELQEVRVEYMALKSPIDGIVEKIVQREGEVANIDKPSVVVVKNDPMYVEVKTLPTTVVQALQKGQELEVRYAPAGEWKKATISFIAPVADARAGQQAIRLELPNPENRSTGQEMDVKIPVSSQTAAK